MLYMRIIFALSFLFSPNVSAMDPSVEDHTEKILSLRNFYFSDGDDERIETILQQSKAELHQVLKKELLAKKLSNQQQIYPTACFECAQLSPGVPSPYSPR